MRGDLLRGIGEELVFIVNPIDLAWRSAQASHSPSLAGDTRAVGTRSGENPESRPLAREWASPFSRIIDRLPASQETDL